MGIAIIARPGGMKPPKPPSRGGPPSPRMSPPKPPTDEAPQAGDAGGKASHEECLFISADKHCGNCANYSPEDGSCAKVVGTMDPEDACLRYFKSLGEDESQGAPEQEPDADEMGAAAGGPPQGAAQ